MLKSSRERDYLEVITPAELFSYGMRRALDYLGMWVWHSRVQRVRIQSNEPDVIQQVMLRLPPSIKSVDLPVDNLASSEKWSWLITVDAGAEAVLYPFSLETGMPLIQADHMIGCFRNTLSYKKILHPASKSLTIRQVVHQLKFANYRCEVEQLRGIYPPTFIAIWALAMLADRLALPIYFPLKDYALRHITASRFERLLSYIVVFHGQS
ncbi:MAG: hypothetical protein ABI947_19040 [Chloroflexota bacterium]